MTSEIKQNKIFGHLHQFLALIVRQNLPFKDFNIWTSVASGWYESAQRDEAACFALLAHGAKDQSRITGSSDMRLLGLKYEIQATSLLRQRIESRTPLTEEVLFAASIHYMSAAFTISDATQLDEMLHGMRAVVDHFGGIDQVVASMSPSTVFSVQYTDIFNALVNAKAPTFVQLDKPSRPLSFSTAIDTDKPGSLVSDISCFESDVLDVMEVTNFLLYFRNPSQQSRGLIKEEHLYLCSVEYWLNYRLSLLQCKYVGTASFNELVVIAMIIVKIEIVAVECSHTILVLAVLRRLRTTIDSYRSMPDKNDQVTVEFEFLAIWACVIALVGQSLPHERSWFICYLRAALPRRYGEDPAEWPSSMEDQLRTELRQFPWHSRIDLCFLSVCNGLRNLPTLPRRDRGYSVAEIHTETNTNDALQLTLPSTLEPAAIDANR